MSIVFVIIGIVIGFAISKIMSNSEIIHGVIDVDHNTKMCKIHISSDELSNRETKIVHFLVNHDGKIESRDEQPL